MQRNSYIFVGVGVIVFNLTQRNMLQEERIRITFIHLGCVNDKDYVTRAHHVLTVINLGKAENDEERNDV